MTDLPVIIAGAGPSGLLTALGLARAGVSVTVLEAERDILPSPRAMVYHWAVLEGLQELDLFSDIDRRGFRKQDFQYRHHPSGETVEWSMNVLEGYTEYPFNLHLGQHELAAIALEHLERHSVAKVLWGTAFESARQDSEGVTVTAVTADGPVELRGSYLLGADGARSRVRRFLDLPFEGMTWDERFVATNVRYDFEADGFAQSTQLADPHWGAIISKIDQTGLWRFTYSESDDLPLDTVLDRMPAHMAAVVGRPVEYVVDAHQAYRMHQRIAPTLRVGRILLIGDAAHATNPTGGFGLTSGIFSSYALVPVLAAVLEGAPDTLLDRWSRERRRVFLNYASPQASELKRMLYSEQDPVRQRADLERLREGTQDPDRLRERLRFAQNLITPILAMR